MQSYNVAAGGKHSVCGVRRPAGLPFPAVTTGSLLLYPADPGGEPPDAPAVARTLAMLGLTGDLLAAPATYRAGPAFLRHVTFLGCAPHLVLEPPADGGAAFSHVAIAGPFAAPRLVVGTNTAAPRCPACRARLEGWRAALADWVDAPLAARARCPGCGAAQRPADLDWRDSAAVGRLFVEVRNVFPGEAVPGDELLAALHGLGGGAWRYAWVSGLPASG